MNICRGAENSYTNLPFWCFQNHFRIYLYVCQSLSYHPKKVGKQKFWFKPPISYSNFVVLRLSEVRSRCRPGADLQPDPTTRTLAQANCALDFIICTDIRIKICHEYIIEKNGGYNCPQHSFINIPK